MKRQMIIRRTLFILLLCLTLLIAIMLVRTFRFTSKQIRVPSLNDLRFNERRAAERLAQAIRFKTVSRQGSTQVDREPFAGLRGFLERSFPSVHATLQKEVVGGDSLLYGWKGTANHLKPMLLMAHLDVVPVEPGTERQWTHPAFAGRIADGFIWGRGAMDDKVCVVSILEAVETLLKEGFQPRRTVYLAFGHDEEIGGEKGAARVAALLKSRGVELESVLDEGLLVTHGIVPGVSKPVAMVGIAEKGYLSLQLSVQSQGGHSSMPPPHTAVGILSGAVRRLEEHPVPGGIEGPVQEFFNQVGAEMTFEKRLAFANLWLFRRLVEKQLSAAPETNALIRTTTAVTMFRGGVKENVLPSAATAVVNFRVRPGDSIASVTQYVRRTVDDKRVKVKIYGDVPSEPSAVSDTAAPAFQTLERTIRQVFPEAVVAPSLFIGATDARHFAPLSRNVYRFSPQRVGSKDLNRIHGVNERIAVKNYAECVKFYYQLIRNSAGVS
jgi:carboxypeptidase PM20D1